MAESERLAIHYMPPKAPDCGTCLYEGQSMEEWPCRTSWSAAGLMCWPPKTPPKEAHHGTARA